MPAHYPSGVPNPYTTHIHPYPTRFHGGIWKRPVFGLPYVRSPLNIIRPSQRGVGSDWDTGTGVFRRPAADGGGLFNQISGLGEMSAAAKTFIGAGVLSFGLVFVLFGRKKKTMTANSSCSCHRPNRRRRRR